MFDKTEITKAITDAVAAKLFGAAESPSAATDYSSEYRLGETILIRTCTMYAIGTVDKIGPLFVHLREAGWCVDTGTYETALAAGEVTRFERCPGVRRVAHGAIVDIDIWNHALPSGVE